MDLGLWWLNASERSQAQPNTTPWSTVPRSRATPRALRPAVMSDPKVGSDRHPGPLPSRIRASAHVAGAGHVDEILFLLSGSEIMGFS